MTTTLSPKDGSPRAEVPAMRTRANRYCTSVTILSGGIKVVEAGRPTARLTTAHCLIEWWTVVDPLLQGNVREKFSTPEAAIASAQSIVQAGRRPTVYHDYQDFYTGYGPEIPPYARLVQEGQR